MEQTDITYNNIYDAPKTEFKLTDDGKKHCFKCKHYSCLVNQGYWWCDLQLNMVDPENCSEYDGSIYENATITYSSTTIPREEPKGGMTPKQYGESLIGKGKRKRTR